MMESYYLSINCTYEMILYTSDCYLKIRWEKVELFKFVHTKSMLYNLHYFILFF